MNKFVVRQPIKDVNHNTIGYEILFQEENESLYNQSNDYAAADTISGFLMQNNDKVFNDKVTFMTFTPNLLFKNTPKIFKQRDLVIQIGDSLIIHPLAQVMIQRFRREGYHFAVNDFQFAPRYFSMMEYIDYIKLNFDSSNTLSLSNIIKLAKGFQKKCVATGINSKEAFETAKELGADYFQGTYMAETMTTKANKMEYLQSNFFQLVVAVTKDEPNMDEIEEIITRDASLTYAILKMVNSVYFALRHRTSSIKQALVVLGLGQLKQWVYLLSFKQDGGGASEDLLKTSFLRANFCSELLPYIENMPISKSEAYLMGMFSTLGYLIDASLEEIFVEIPISDEIKNALIKHEGRCGQLYDLVLNYEKADWKNIKKYAGELGIPANVISQIYFNCVEDVNHIWESLTNSYENQQTDKEEESKKEIQEKEIEKEENSEELKEAESEKNKENS